MNRLLIVDDEPDVVDGLYRLFCNREDLELDVLRACSGPEALRIMQSQRIDVMLSDIRMPGMSGLELFAKVRAQWPRCRVVFLTGHTDFEAIYQASRDGAASYLLKTESREAIAEAVIRALDDLSRALAAGDLLARAQGYAARARSFANREILAALWGGELTPADCLRGVGQLDGGEGGRFDPGAPVLAMAAQVNRAANAPFGWDRLFLAMDGLVGSYLGPEARRAIAQVLRGLGLCLFQGHALDVARLLGAAEAMQSALTLDWDADVSVALWPHALEPGQIGPACQSLAKLLAQGLSVGAGILVAQSGQAPASALSEARAITMVKQYVAEHLSEELSLSLLASRVFLNPSYLSRLFRRETGITLVGYINAARVEKAMELLERTNMRIGAIAAQVGLESPSYFNQVFRKHLGIAPQEYRQQKVK